MYRERQEEETTVVVELPGLEAAAESSAVAVNKRTATKNRDFAKMTRAQKRVTIARDVLLALASGTVTATAGMYLDYSMATDEDMEERPFRELLPKLDTCDVCAKGAILICAARRGAIARSTLGREVQDLEFDGHLLAHSLRNIFSWSQLELIEDAFEDRAGIGPGDLTAMEGIMRNIIRNKGTFVPPRS